MNCGSPIAPAQEPLSFSRGTISLIQNHQRGDEFVAKKLPVLAQKSKRRERADDVLAALRRAEIGLHAPCRDDDRGRNAKALRDAGEFAAPSRQCGAAARDARRRDRLGEIGFQRLVEFGLFG